jgi:hypothetical protein
MTEQADLKHDAQHAGCTKAMGPGPEPHFLRSWEPVT